MKKLLSILIAIILMLSSVLSFSVMADDGIRIIINSEPKTFDVMPQIIDGRTMVPMRGIFEAFGATITWVDVTKTVVAETPDVALTLTVGKTTAKVNGETKNLDVPAQIIEGRTLVPVRFIAESLGCNVEWQADTKTVVIGNSKEAAPKDDKLPEGGQIAVFPEDLLNVKGKTVKSDGSVATVTVAEKGADTSVMFTYRTGLSAMIKEGDVCMLSFKIRLVSDGENGEGYIKAQVQADGEHNPKALFARTKVTGEWTTAYMPFVALDKMSSAGFRFGAMKQVVEIKDLQITNYGKDVDVKSLPSTIIVEDKAVANGIIEKETTTTKKEETTTAPSTPVVAPEVAKDAKLPEGGKVIVTPSDMLNAKSKNLKAEDGAAVITSKEAGKDTSVMVSYKSGLAALMNVDDVCMLTFKVRLKSDGEGGEGYIKAQIQAEGENYPKALFARTKVTGEWTTAYMPFKALDKMASASFRFGAMIQVVEIKDLQIINYGKDMDITTLPSTIIVEKNSIANGLKVTP